jgi:small GTP-binding protein
MFESTPEHLKSTSAMLYVQLFVGLDGAGKTSIISALQGKISGPDPEPTVGFNAPAELNVGGHNIVVYDVGGGAGIRTIWSEYLAEIHGIVFVVDGSCQGRLPEACDELQHLMHHKYGQGKALVVLGNKSDLDGAISVHELAAGLMLDIKSSKYDCLGTTSLAHYAIALAQGSHICFTTINNDMWK